MRLSPEFRDYSRVEFSNDPYKIANDINASPKGHVIGIFSPIRRRSPKMTIFREKPNDERFKTTTLERIVDSVDAAYSRSVRRFFKTVDYMHRHSSRTPLFSWEEDFFDHIPELGDRHEKQMWIALQQKGIGSKDMLALKILREHGIPDELLARMSNQAEGNNKRDIEFFRKWSLDQVKDLIDHWGVAPVLQSVAKGLVTVVPQHPGVDGLYFLGGSMAGDEMSLDQLVRTGDTFNFFARAGSVFDYIWDTYYRSHSGALAKHTEFTELNISQMSLRIFEGIRNDLESSMLRREAKGIALGVGIAQLAQDASSGSLKNAIINLIGPALAALYLYVKLHREVSGADFDKYLADQTRFNDEIDRLKGSISSMHDEPLEETELPGLLHELKRDTRRTNRITRGAIQRTPTWLAFGTEVFEFSHVTQLNPGTQSLVTGTIIAATMGRYADERTRIRNARIKDVGLGSLERMLDAVDANSPSSDQAIKDVPDEKMLSLSSEEILRRMAGDVVIDEIQSPSSRFVLSLSYPMRLPPGLSCVRGPVGAGKSTLLRALSFKERNLATISKGAIKLNEVPSDQLSDFVVLVEEQDPPGDNDTLAQRMFPAIRDPNSLFCSYIFSRMNFGNELVRKYGEPAMGRFSSIMSHSNRADELNKKIEMWLNAWAEDPLGKNVHNEPELEIAIGMFTDAFFHFASDWGKVPNIDTVNDAADFLTRKLGLGRTSKGETQILRMLTAFSRSPQFLLLDEPTANLTGERDGPFNPTPGSIDAFARMLLLYIMQYPDAVVVIASNDSKLQNRIDCGLEQLFGEKGNIISRIIHLAPESTRQNVVWMSSARTKTNEG